MNKKLFRFILLGLLLIVALILMLNEHKGSYKKELRDFAIEDTSTVDKIFLVNKENKQILLEKQKGHWVLNEKYEARKDLVNLILKTLHRVKVKEPVGNAAIETIIKNMAVKSTKVEIYQNKKLVKTIYVGGPTPDSRGTYMLIDGSNRPFVVEIPGFKGYLSTRFSTSENNWKSQMMLTYKTDEISEVSLTNNLNPEASFTIKHQKNNLELIDKSGNAVSNFDTAKVKQYLFEFHKKAYSKFADDVPQEYIDSILQTSPMYIIDLKLTNGTEKIHKAYNKPGWGYLDFEGTPMKKDPDYFFFLMDNGDFVYAQYFSFDPIFKGIKDFMNKE